MDDFLHNLRSGKLKSDRTNRQYGDQQFKGGQRRNVNDRRKGHHDNKESTERLNALKEVLESLAETQKKMAQAYEERTRAEERKAKALEVLATNVYRMLNPQAADADNLFAASSNSFPGDDATHGRAVAGKTKPEATNASSDIMEADDSNSDEEEGATPGNRLSEEDRETLHPLIGKMRDEGSSWENIARHIASEGYPTISGKGNWRGVMVKNLFEKMSD